MLSHYVHYLKYKEKNEDDFFAMIGHSLGEYSALVAAESLDINDGMKLVQKRGELMKKATVKPCGMLIIRFKKIN